MSTVLIDGKNRLITITPDETVKTNRNETTFSIDDHHHVFSVIEDNHTSKNPFTTGSMTFNKR
jgi:hypothetical protein